MSEPNDPHPDPMNENYRLANQAAAERKTIDHKRQVLQWDKIGDELGDFWHEVVVENGPRYRDWKQWGDLYIDMLNSFFGMSYFLAHLVGLALPIWGLYSVYSWIVR